MLPMFKFKPRASMSLANTLFNFGSFKITSTSVKSRVASFSKFAYDFEKEFANLFYTIRDAVLLPVEDYLNKDVIPRKKLSDFNLEVYAMHQIEGEEEPIKLLGEY